MVDPVYTSKIIFLLFLIGICFFGFGLDFISRFCASEITVNESVEQKQALKPPAITICPQVGWKNSNTSTEAGFKVLWKGKQCWEVLELPRREDLQLQWDCSLCHSWTPGLPGQRSQESFWWEAVLEVEHTKSPAWKMSHSSLWAASSNWHDRWCYCD